MRSTQNEKRGLELAFSESRLWAQDKAVYTILYESESIEEARERLFVYLCELEWEYRENTEPFERLKYTAALSAIDVFKNIVSRENEDVAECSTLQLLWSFVHESENSAAIGKGFIDEVTHLLRAINADETIFQGWIDDLNDGVAHSDSQRGSLEGRQAAIARSRNLDRMASIADEHIEGYPSGLDPELQERRKQNRALILKCFNASMQDWYEPSWQFSHILKGRRGIDVLSDLVPLGEDELSAIELAVGYDIPWGITPYYLSLFDFESACRKIDGQIRSQVNPPMYTVQWMIEHSEDRGSSFDFMGEHDTSPIDLVTRRYPMIAILKVADTCPQICVYCQRNWEINEPMVSGSIPTEDKVDRALQWFADHPAMKDVLITGGDPLIVQNSLLERILDRLARLDHIRNIRIGTRIPVTMPMQVTDRLAKMLNGYLEPGRRNLSVVTHVESAAEVTLDLAGAVNRLKSRGIMVYNQQVFTIETSRRFQTVATRVALKEVGIDPYYTFYTKGKEEHRDYLVPIARILQERNEEARLLPGIFRTDEPVFNVPRLGKVHLRASQDRELIGIDRNGRRVYLFHPWEKGIAQVEPWTYVDTSIHDYLARLKEIGENPRDYESIWYYY